MNRRAPAPYQEADGPALRSVSADTGIPVVDALAAIDHLARRSHHLAADLTAGDIRPGVARMWSAWIGFVRDPIAGFGRKDLTPHAIIDQAMQHVHVATDHDVHARCATAFAQHQPRPLEQALLHLQEFGDHTVIERFTDRTIVHALLLIEDTGVPASTWHAVATGRVRQPRDQAQGLADHLTTCLADGSPIAADLLAHLIEIPA